MFIDWRAAMKVPELACLNIWKKRLVMGNSFDIRKANMSLIFNVEICGVTYLGILLLKP
jgi:hypothetical protein